jgi:hypothetical protein
MIIEVTAFDQIQLLKDSILMDTGWYIVETKIGKTKNPDGSVNFVNWLRNMYAEEDLLMLGDSGRYYNIEEKYPRKAEILFKELAKCVV